MKLSVIYQYGNIETVKCIIEQLTDDAELVIYAKKTTNKLKAVAAGNVRIVRKKDVVSEANGDFVSFILADDEITDCYVESLLEAITEDADYIPIRWKDVCWHDFTFSGCNPLPYIFTNVYRKNIKITINGCLIDKEELKKYQSGKPLEKVTYKHYWRFDYE